MKRLVCALALLATASLVGCGTGEKGLPFDPTPPYVGTPSVTREAGTNRVLVEALVYDVGNGVASVSALAVVTGSTATPFAMQAVPGTELYQAALPVSTVRLQVKAVDRNGNETVSSEVRVPPPGPPF